MRGRERGRTGSESSSARLDYKTSLANIHKQIMTRSHHISPHFVLRRSSRNSFVSNSGSPGKTMGAVSIFKNSSGPPAHVYEGSAALYSASRTSAPKPLGQAYVVRTDTGAKTVFVTSTNANRTPIWADCFVSGAKFPQTPDSLVVGRCRAAIRVWLWLRKPHATVISAARRRYNTFRRQFILMKQEGASCSSDFFLLLFFSKKNVQKKKVLERLGS